MDLKQEIEQIREEFGMSHSHNMRVLRIFDALLKENQELKAKMMMKFKDIDDEQ